MDRYVVLGVGRYIVNLEEILEVQYAARGRPDQFEIIGFIDSNPEKHGQKLFGYPVLGPIDWVLEKDDVFHIVSFVNPHARSELVMSLLYRKNCLFPNIIHPSAIISRKARIGKGNIFAQNVVIAPYVIIGDFVHLNYSAAIGHDCTLGNFVTCNGGAHVAGGSILEDRVFVGPGAVIIDGVTVGQGAKVGANAVVRKDVPTNATAVGIPAKFL